MKYVFIINPISGGGRGLKMYNRIKNICEIEKLDYDIHLTKQKNDATDIAKKYKRDSCIIYSVGGDGTLNEVLNGIIGTKNMLGIIPCGCGNDFYRVIKDRQDTLFKIDIGKLNKVYFINVASIGIDAEVGDNVKIMKKKHIPSSLIYKSSIVYTFFTFKFKEIEFILNNTLKKGEYTIITICNGSYYGGGYCIGPSARIDDGKFDIYFVDKISKLQIPKMLNKLKSTTHEESPHVHKRISDSIKIISKKEIICNYDGESIIDKKFSISLLPDEVTIYNNKQLVKKIMN
ncbi:MAG: YegS/Rv2252/BmrU family lipid kinase [bacterium]|nr:YegS/Rv2252/BmrU family lipid kinase [bacterium]